MIPDIEAATMRRVFTRLIPLLFAMMFINYLDPHQHPALPPCR